MKILAFTCFALATTLLISVTACNKEHKTLDTSLFYGKWKSNIGDTIYFAQRSGRNEFNYDMPVNPVAVEFKSEDNRFYLSDEGVSSSFRQVQTFNWIHKGEIFEVQVADLFLFKPSVLTLFTYTKIP